MKPMPPVTRNFMRATLEMSISSEHSFNRFDDGLRFVTAEREIDHDRVTDQRNQKGGLNRAVIGNIAHNSGNNGTADDGHYQQRRAKFGVGAEILDAQCEDRGKHYGIEEAEQNDGPNGHSSGQENRDDGANGRGGGENAKQPVRRDALHDCGTGKTSDHEAEEVPPEVIRRRLFGRAGKHALRETNYEARDSYLSADVEKLGDDAADQVLVVPDARVGWRRGFWLRERFTGSLANFGQVSKIDQNGDQQKYSRDRQIGAGDAFGFRCRINLPLLGRHRGECSSGIFDSRENEDFSYIRSHPCTHGVEGLREVQATLGRFRRAENRDVRIRGYFKNALPAGHHKKCEQKKTVGANGSGGNKEERPKGTGSKAH